MEAAKMRHTNFATQIFFQGVMRVIRKIEMREMNYWCAVIARNFLLIFYLCKIGRKLHKEHSFWKEKRKSMSLDGTRPDTSRFTRKPETIRENFVSEHVPLSNSSQCFMSSANDSGVANSWRTPPKSEEGAEESPPRKTEVEAATVPEPKVSPRIFLNAFPRNDESSCLP